jgi:hypothetical protein
MHAGPRISRNGRGRMARILVVWLGLLASSAVASSTQAECFCLMHASGAILRGCIAYKARTDFYTTAVCTDPETKQTAEQLITSEWQRIPAGQDRCNPCRRQVRRATDEVPRQGDQPDTVPPRPSRP